MAIELEFDRTHSPTVVIGRARGVLGIDDLRDFVVRVAASPANTPDTPELLDLRDSTVGDITADEIGHFAQLVDALYGEPKRAPLVLVADRELAYGLARVYSAHREAVREVRVFRSMAEARAWLNLHDPAQQAGAPRSRPADDAPA